MAASMLASCRPAQRSFLRIIRSKGQSHSIQAVSSRSLNRPSSVLPRSLACLSSTQHGSPVNCLPAQPFRKFHLSKFLASDVQVVQTPGFPESVSEGDVRWEKAVGDEVSEDEVVGEIETDKTAIQIMAPSAGVIEELLVADGEKVIAGQDLFKLNVGAGGAAPAKPAAAPKAAEPVAAAPPPPLPAVSSAGSIPTSPPPVPQVPTGPMESTPASEVPVKKYAAPSGTVPSEAPADERKETRVKMNRMRQRIAQRLKGAQETYAMLTTFNEVDMSNIMELRSTYKDAFVKKHGVKFGFMSAFIRAAAAGLVDMPSVNAVIDQTEIVYRDYVDISVAVATPKGLVVPVLRGVEKMDYADIEHNLAALGEKARSGLLAIEDMDGGTFTISNGGVFGSLMGTPIINPPQSAILGMHGIFDRPVAVKGQVQIRPMMYIALTYDHRLIDGREAVTFLRKVKSGVEDPRTLLLNL
ncbi:hypothetical protein CAPTEDRAFT_221108 [Capitella teleta]|uniref:Dihydrolipoyllysine-residue succinyltransferase component of 2-oxoglutarate dehydrogenase complex, mitochondrial n=1 Tax=Capitella teleta TaxID=283909 RepID=R7VCP9_CAPTE|nr:hypothetical protein CAPTEDRAFT_221108 [Capitella teleta]|eukprot:ELU16332.1 hypothetical protein CAPTEDRAFT_221108 [Capitella teleta]